MIAITSLLPIFGYAAIFYIYFKRTVSVSIFFSITSIITILFVLGMLDVLKYGTFILFYGGIGLLIFVGIWFRDQLFAFIKSVPFVMFSLMSIIYLYLMQDAKFFFWDEFSHWGAFIKEMYYFHHFYDAMSVASHLNYPPGISIWDYFIMLPIGFSEGKVYFTYFLILFSSTLMMYERLSFGQLHWIALVFMIQMILFATFGHWFSSIYVDHVIGALFAGLIMTYLVDYFSGKQFLLFIFPLVTIVLVKEIGLYFGFAAIGLMLILQIFRANVKNDKSLLFSIKEQKQIIFILLILAVTMVMVLKVWGIRQESIGVKKELQTISGITKSIFSEEKALSDEVEAEVKRRFWEVVFSQQLHKEKVSLNYNEFSYGIMSKFNSPLKLSAVGSFLFFIFISIVAYFLISTRTKKTEIGIISSYLLIIGTIYLFILYFSYLVAFGNHALRLQSYVRYMNMVILPLMFIGFTYFLPLFYYKSQNMTQQDKRCFLTSLGILALLFFITKPYFKPLYSQLESKVRINIDQATENILRSIPQKSTLFVVFPVKNNGSLNHILKYSLIPARATISHSNFSQKTSKEMMETFMKYEYVWFASLNQELVNKNKSFLRTKPKNKIYTLYKLEKEKEQISFKPIE